MSWDVDEFCKTLEKTGRVMEELGKSLKELKDKSKMLRILIWFDDLWFGIKKLFRR